MEQQIKPDAWGSARIARISQQFLHQNCQQMLQKEHCHPVTLQIWMEWRYHVWERCTELFWNLHPKPKTVSKLKVTGEDMRQFTAGPIDKDVPSFTSSLTMSTWTVTEDILSIYLYSKSVRTYGVCAILNSKKLFDNVSTDKLPW